MRLARTHAASVSGDALFAIGLAGSVFFSLDFNSARWRVALYLVLTIAPFAVAAPLIGPAVDRIKGGRRWIIVGTLFARAVLCVLVVRHMETLLFYPEAFGMLVVQKVYSISKSAVVPGTVRSDEELVEANSKLTVLSALAVVVAALPGGILLKLGGGGWSVALGALIFGVGTVLALQLPPTQVAPEPVGEQEKEELRSAGIVAASSAMGSMRGIVGFLSFMLAFAIKEDGALWELGLVAAAAQVGFFFGAVAAPRVRRLASEEHIIAGALVLTAVIGTVTALIGGLAGAAMMSMAVGATGSASKMAFDSIVQRDAPDANRGRSFAKFETRFQLVWVIGALIPIVIPIPAQLGFAVIAAAALGSVLTYQLGLRRIRQGKVPVRRQIWPRRGRGTPTETGLGVALDDDLDPTLTGAPTPPAPPSPTDPTVVVPPTAPAPTDPSPAAGVAAEPAAPAAAPGSAEPTVVAGTGAVATPQAPVDPARRWMRSPTTTTSPTSPPPPPMPGSVPLPFPDTPSSASPAPVPSAEGSSPTGDDGEGADVPTAGPVAADPVTSPSAGPGDVPGHRRKGLLFDPEAWDDPGVPPATPPPPGNG